MMRVYANKEMLRARMEGESERKKLLLAIIGAAFFILSAVSSGIFLSLLSNANEINKKLCQIDPVTCDMVNNNVYDVGFLLWDQWTDNEAALTYINEIAKLDSDTYAKGCRFTIVYSLCGFIFLVQACVYLSLIFGAWFLKVRLLGLLCNVLVSCAFIAAIVTTGVFRLNAMGQLAALSTCPTKYDSTASADYYLSTKTTYADDAKVVLCVWIVCLVACPLNGCYLYALNQSFWAKENQQEREGFFPENQNGRTPSEDKPRAFSLNNQVGKSRDQTPYREQIDEKI